MPLEDPERHTQILKDNSLIGKFMGLWPNLQAIIDWACEVWKPLINNKVSVFVLSNGFFLTLFASLKDRDSIFKLGHFFMGSKGLFLAPQTLDFNPIMEMLEVPVLVKLSHFPFFLWHNDNLKLIGNKLG